ncbi:MAG: hypothetical protein JW893_02780 [Candidatus Omnitrophica bacterium]|nr:hypothetical protein [Candidatus Omnitrophota bacterium]
MYRESDSRLFMLLSLASTFCLVTALGCIVVYHFYQPTLMYRDIGLAFLIFSSIFKLHDYLHRVQILEKRVSAMLQPAQRKPTLGKSTGPLGLLLYAVIFWVVLLFVLIAFIPVQTWKL